MSDIIIDGKIFKSFDENYYVSEYGEIFSAYSKKILKPGIDLNGYPRIEIHKKHIKIHKLVYLTWIGPLEEGQQINHKDDNKLNNHYLNLYAGTQKQNINDCKNNNHRVGNIWYLTLFDKEKNQILTFCPASDFIKYSGHPCANQSVKRQFSRNWFKKRYSIIEYKKINNLSELKGVTTSCDECNSVG